MMVQVWIGIGSQVWKPGSDIAPVYLLQPEPC